MFTESNKDYKPDRPIPVSLIFIRSAIRKLRIGLAKIKSFGKLNCSIDFMIGPGCSFLARDFIRIGTNVSFGASVIVESNLNVGDNTLVSSQVAFVGNDHDYTDPNTTIYTGRRFPPATVILEGDNLIGFRSIIIGNVKIGRGCIVGAGSIVTKDLPPYSVCVGSPARKIRDRF